MTPTAIVIVIFSSALGLFLVVIAALGRVESKGHDDGVKAMQDEAVRKGHAEFYLDEHNTRRWRWKGEK